MSSCLIVVGIFYKSEWIILISRAIVGITCGFMTTTAPRMMIECLPQSKRGVGGLFSNSVAFGVCVAFSLGYLLGDKILADNWYWILLAPAMLALFRMIIIILFFRFETPVYMYAKIHKIKLNEQEKGIQDKIQIMPIKQKIQDLMLKFNKNPNDIRFEKQLIKEVIKQGYSKGENSMWDLIKTNILSKKRVMSFLAVQGYMAFTSWSGQTYNDSYSNEVFSNFVDKDFANKIVFYSGFAVLAGSITGGLILNFIPRKDFILGIYFLQLVAMYFITMSMYFQWTYAAVAFNLSYSFL